MIPFQAAIELGEHLEQSNYHVEYDGYKEFKTFPMLLIEVDGSNYIKKSGSKVLKKRPKLFVTALVSMPQHKSYKEARIQAETLAQYVTNDIAEFSSERFNLDPIGESESELMIGSIKCCGVAIEYDVYTSNI